MSLVEALGIIIKIEYLKVYAYWNLDLVYAKIPYLLG